MSIITDTASFEAWLGQQLTIVPEDLVQKHIDMASAPFPCFRATYYRRAKRFQKLLPKLAKRFRTLSVADIHIANFGTWRDAEGRLVWGVNDFDECWILAYCSDLVTLLSSFKVAAADGHFLVSPTDACVAVRSGYRKGLENGAQPFILAGKHPKLRRMAQSELRDPALFWQKMLALPQLTGKIPASAKKALVDALPTGTKFDLYTRRAGEGSLGRQRFVAIAPDFEGGEISREAKALAPSAHNWVDGAAKAKPSFYNQILTTAARCNDPCLTVSDEWIVRRLAPDCSRIELAQLSAVEDELALLKAMGRELANIHAPDAATAKAILADMDDLEKADPDWLRDGMNVMAQDALDDQHEWRAYWTALQKSPKGDKKAPDAGKTAPVNPKPERGSNGKPKGQDEDQPKRKKDKSKDKSKSKDKRKGKDKSKSKDKSRSKSKR